MRTFLASGGLGDAVMAFGKLSNFNEPIHLIHVHKTGILTKELKEFYNYQNIDHEIIEADFSWIKENRSKYEKELSSTWYATEDGIEINPKPKINYKKVDVDVVISPFAGQNRNRGLDVKDLEKFLCNTQRKITYIGNTNGKDTSDIKSVIGNSGYNLIDKTTLTEAIDIICSANVVIAPEGFVTYMAGIAGRRVLIYNYNLPAIKDRTHPSWDFELFNNLQEVVRKMDKYSLEDKENHITHLWGSGGGCFSNKEEICFSHFQKLNFKGGKVLEVGPGTGKFATMIVQNYPVSAYTVLDLKKNIHNAMDAFSNIGFSGKFVESKDYKQTFNRNYDLFVANFVLSEVPEYYREDIAKYVWPNCESVFVVDGDSNGNFNSWLEESIRRIFPTVTIEESGCWNCRVITGRRVIRLEPGLQPYIADEDTTNPDVGIPRLQKLFEKISPHLSGSILDVGCGNGRLNVIHSKYFNKIIGIDKFRDPNPIYASDKFEFSRKDIFGCSEKVDVVLFMGTFYLHYPYGYEFTLRKALELGHTVVILDDATRNIRNVVDKSGHYDVIDLAERVGKNLVQKVIQEDGPLGVYVIK